MSEFEVLAQQIHSCTLCTLSEKRTTAVPGEGSQTADIMFIGEGPGFYEDRDGRPFVGPAGQLLDKLLSSIGLKREDVYITNMIKCRPPNNRDPLPGEIRACKPYLDRQMDMIRPKVVVTLGRHSLSRWFPGEAIGKARGKPRKRDGVTVYPMYHPAAALRNQGLLSALEQDFQKLLSLLDDEAAEAEEPAGEQAEQLSLL